jgi:hypothetical protein
LNPIENYRTYISDFDYSNISFRYSGSHQTYKNYQAKKEFMPFLLLRILALFKTYVDFLENTWLAGVPASAGVIDVAGVPTVVVVIPAAAGILAAAGALAVAKFSIVSCVPGAAGVSDFAGVPAIAGALPTADNPSLVGVFYVPGSGPNVAGFPTIAGVPAAAGIFFCWSPCCC